MQAGLTFTCLAAALCVVVWQVGILHCRLDAVCEDYDRLREALDDEADRDDGWLWVRTGGPPRRADPPAQDAVDGGLDHHWN